jgi:diacylglycerol kinase family enzyme
VALRVAPKAQFETGLDLVAPERMRARDLPRFLRYAVGRGDVGQEQSFVVVHDADRIEVACDLPLPLQADGEDLGDVEHVVFEAERDAVTVLV